MDSNKTIGFDRRDFLKGATGAALLLTSRNGFGFAKCYDDDALLAELAHRCYQYFWDASDPETGICRDLIHGDTADYARKGDEARGSTGVTGFCLTAHCIGAERKWITRNQAKDVLVTRRADGTLVVAVWNLVDPPGAKQPGGPGAATVPERR